MSQRRVFVLGGRILKFLGKNNPDFIDKRHALFGRQDNPTLEQLITGVVTSALEATGVTAAQIQRSWIGNYAAEVFCNQGHLGAALAGAHKDLEHKPSQRVEAACASGGLAFSSAVQSLLTGRTDVALVVGAEVQTTVSPRQGGDYLARASHYRKDRALDDFTFPALFARRAKHSFSELGWSPKDMAAISAKAYANGNLNPLAHMRTVKFDPNSYAEQSNAMFLSNPDLKPFLRTSDCSQVSDGAAAAILVSEEGLKRLGKRMADCVEVLACEEGASSLYEDGSYLELTNMRAVAARAYDVAGVKPSDINIAEVHDCFSIAELQMYEALGWAAPGKGPSLIHEGVTTRSGRLPVNTGGGLISFGHPVGATGVKQILEVVRQMKGQCGDYQATKTPAIGLCANMGGNDKTGVVTILKNL